MRLLHYSKEPIAGPLKDRSDELGVEMKPHGLWFSVEGEYDWKWWCDAENFRPDMLKCVTEVTLKPGANILRLSRPEAIDAVTVDYGRTLKGMDAMRMPSIMLDDEGNVQWGKEMPFTVFLDWAAIGKLYDGIIIAPYCWDRRLNGGAMWYYGWDCASGCIWNPRAIQAISFLEGEANEACTECPAAGTRTGT